MRGATTVQTACLEAFLTALGLLNAVQCNNRRAWPVRLWEGTAGGCGSDGCGNAASGGVMGVRGGRAGGSARNWIAR